MGSVEEGLRADVSHRPGGDRLMWWGLSLEREIVACCIYDTTCWENPRGEMGQTYIRKWHHL